MNKMWLIAGVLCLSVGATAASNTVDNQNSCEDTFLAASGKNKKHSPDRQKNEEQKEAMPSFLQLGGDYTYVSFKPAGLPSFHGNLGGAQVSYEYKRMDSFYGALTTDWKQGHMHGTDGKRHLLYIDVQERFGYTATCAQEKVMFTFFTGLGYRHLGHKFIPSTGSVLYFRYNELYVPVGVLADFVAASWFTLKLEFTWMPQVYPTVSIVPLKGARWILTEQLANFYGSIPLDFTLTKGKTFHLVIEPFYERWKDGHSTAKTSTGIPLGLPGNTYNFWGVNVNFGFQF